AELATRCRHTCVPAGGSAEATFTKLTNATPLQTEAFRLLGLTPASHGARSQASAIERECNPSPSNEIQLAKR
ncbi:MAG: hypothetical protein ABIP48_06515, partial [Planctomycetota bacterium]